MLLIQLEVLIPRVQKRDGRIVKFDVKRIENAIKKAMQSIGKYDRKKLEKVLEKVVKILNERYEETKKIPHVEEIQDVIEYVLVKFGLYEVAKAYILYRKEREKIREAKKKILQKDVIDEVDKSFSLNALQLLAARYLRKDENGNLVESPKQLFQRVAMLVVIPDILYDPKVFDKEGKQKPWPKEKFEPDEWDGKVGLRKVGKSFQVKWNKWHLERMKYLYDELNQQGKMKVPWSKFFEMLLNGEFDEHYKDYRQYYNLMVSKKFMPNSPTLFNAGTRLGQLSACFVLDVDDDMESIMDSAKEASIIFKTGGGIGINYSKLRPEGDIVASTTGVASGPVSFMRIIDVVTDVVKQGGRRRGANMGILEVWHPDIEKFISAKEEEGRFTNFNISVLITPEFWEYYESGKPYPLINPRNKQVWKKVDPRFLMNTIAMMAWKTGDPGVLFFDNINKHNVLLKAKGAIRSTNPCGEEPLYPYESCNLGSINLYAHLKEKDDGSVEFDWESFEKTVKIALRFLDNIIDVNKFPFKKIEKNTKASRKVGLGYMGLADVLFALKVPYNSENGFEFMRKVTEFMTFHAMKESVHRAKQRGTFPLFEKSSYKEGEMPIAGFYDRKEWTMPWDELVEEIKKHGIRNAEVTTIAPTGSISMLVDVSSGLEPQFALTYEKRVTVGTFYYVDVEFEKQLKERGLYSEDLLKKVADNGGSVQEIEEIPEDMKKVFVVAYDIPWWDHIRAQAEVNKWICAAVSKTINMPNWVTPEDVLKAYIFGHKLGIKGITIYRDGSKSVQVLVTPSQKKGKYVLHIKNKTIDLMKSLGIEPPELSNGKNGNGNGKFVITLPKSRNVASLAVKSSPSLPSPEGKEVCPNCGSDRLVYKDGCVTCIDCGWSACLVA